MTTRAPETTAEQMSDRVAARSRGRLSRPESAWRQRLAELLAIVHLPRVTITLDGDEMGRLLHRAMAGWHPRYRVIGHKCWAIGLLRLPPAFGDFWKGRERQAFRTNVNRCKARGFQGRDIDPIEHLGEIEAIYASTDNRQGRAVMYDPESLTRFARRSGARFVGMFNRDGQLRAITCITMSGEFAWFKMFIGHADDLESGVMYGLMGHALEDLIRRAAREGRLRWVMFDGFFGNKPGMRYFMERCGFEARNVTWRLADPGPV